MCGWLVGLFAGWWVGWWIGLVYRFSFDQLNLDSTIARAVCMHACKCFYVRMYALVRAFTCICNVCACVRS